MTENTHSYSDSIDRRTAVTLISGGLTALAGCSNSSSAGSSASRASEDTASEQSATEGWVPPEEQSEKILSSEIVTDERNRVTLNLQLQNSTEINSIRLVDTLGNAYDTAVPGDGEVQLQIADGPGSSSGELDKITAGENTLQLDSDNGTQRISVNLGTSVEFQEVVTQLDRDAVMEPGNNLGFILKNIGSHPTAVWQISGSNLPNNLNPGAFVSESLLPEYELIEPGSTRTAYFPSSHWQVIGDKCAEYSEHELQFTIQSLWADSISITLPVSYSRTNGERHCGSLNGSPTITTVAPAESSDS